MAGDADVMSTIFGPGMMPDPAGTVDTGDGASDGAGGESAQFSDAFTGALLGGFIASGGLDEGEDGSTMAEGEDGSAGGEGGAYGPLGGNLRPV